MDPLSSAANIIAVLSAAQAVVQGLEKLKGLLHAPEQLLQILNEVSDFQTILVTVQETSRQFHELDLNSEFLLRFHSLIEESDEVINTLLTILKSCVKGDDLLLDSSFDISRKAWFKEQTNIRKLGLELRKRREEITSLLTIVSASRISYVHMDLERISFSSQELHRKLNEYGKDSSERLRILEGNIASIRPQLEEIKSSAQNWQSHKSAAETAWEAQNPSFDYIPLSDAGQAGQKSLGIRVETTLYRQNSCSSGCLCRCHKTYFAKTPKLMEDVIGSLFIGYSNTPMNRKPCNEKLCRQQRSSLLKVNYYFPSWFMHRMVSFKNIWNPGEGHRISVRTPRIVPAASDVFLVADHGNLDAMKLLFTQGLASPFDISAETGQSVLQRAVSKRRIDFCEFLLSQYADPEIEDMQGSSPIDLVWDQWLQNSRLPETQALQRLFLSKLDPSSDLQKRNFTLLHQTVLHLNTLDLQSLLQASTVDIDARCSKGRTPLCWAILRSQLSDIYLLLRHGADITIADYEKNTPLHFACRSSSVECLELVLAALTSALHGSTPNLNPITIYGWTPFQWAAAHDLVDIARALLACCSPDEAVAMIECDLGKYPSAAFHLTVQTNSHEVLKLLLPLGVITDVVDPLGLNLLHLAAVCGDLETIRILANAAVKGIISGCKVDARDSYGYTPLEDFDIVRKKYVTENEKTFKVSRELFLMLLENVIGGGEDPVEKVARLEEVEEEEEEDSDEFCDALCF